MISEFFLTIIFNIVSGAFSLLPEITIDLNASSFDYFLAIVRSACYLLPMGTVRAIISIIIALAWFRIIIAIIKAIWDLLPLV